MGFSLVSPRTTKPPQSNASERFSGRVVGIADGDTITVLRAGREVKVRLHWIDCPERGQAFGRRAKQAKSRLVFGKTVVVEPTDADRYGRTVGRVFVDGQDINLELVSPRMAWWFR
jgi:endonuclease YncB( thermonuclease family)